jgi:exonuclease SbcC
MENFGPFTGKETVDFTTLEDIFLITGKTGSGKTTIFDALCFALYGAVPGSRKGHISRLRSDYAAEGAECSVSLEFRSGEKHYRIERSPRQEKRKKRGTGFTTVEETAVLYELRNGTSITLNGKKSEADEWIRRLLGLEAEEFFKIVLLPQGEFAEFLRQNSTDRRAVLGKLFPVDQAARLRELAQEKSRAASAEVREAERVLAEISKRISFDDLEETRKAALEAVRAAKARSAALAEETDKLKILLTARQNEAAAAERLGDAEREIARNGEEEAGVREKQKRRDLSRTAQPLAHELRREDEKRREAAAAGEDAEKAGEEQKTAEEAAKKAEILAAELPVLEEEERTLREKRPALTELLAEEDALKKDEKEAEILRRRTHTLSEQTVLLSEKKQKKAEEIQNLEELAEKAPGLEARWDEERITKDILVELYKAACDAEVLLTEEKDAAARAAVLETECAELAKRIPVQEDEIRRLRAEKEERERADMAAHLGAGLSEGEPCPVCGSTAHPRPAKPVGAAFSYGDRIAVQEKSLADSVNTLAAKQAEKRSGEQEITRVRLRLEALAAGAAKARSAAPPQEDPAMAAYFGRGGELPEKAETARLREACIASLNIVTSGKEDARRAAMRLTDAHREQHALEQEITEAEKEHSSLAEKLKNLLESIEETKRKRDRILSEAADSAAAIPPSAAGALSALDSRLASLAADIRLRREEGERAGRNLAAAAAREEEARRKQDAAKALAQEAAEALAKALAASPFPDAETLKAALLDSEAEAALEADIARWRDERTRLLSQKEELQRGLEAIREELTVLGDKGEVPSSAALEARLGEMTAEREAAETERDLKTGELAALERDEARLREAHERFTALSQKSRGLSALADDLGGKNPRKKAFDAWLLGRYLAEVAAYATRRLERMSESRYSLLLDSGREPGRALTGLDLAVFDAYTGKCRPCATLSGGESFMASISLALGLADSIQTRSGGVRLDAVFIDEGFGSLDEASLDHALVILDELRDHRMVGLISHVGEMRSRIPSRIEIIKSGSGSKIAAR